jgi:hypothetical protein
MICVCEDLASLLAAALLQGNGATSTLCFEVGNFVTVCFKRADDGVACTASMWQSLISILGML